MSLQPNPRRESLHSASYLTLQRLRGRPVGRLVRQLQNWQSMRPHDFHRLVRSRLAAALERAKRTVPFYSKGAWVSTKAHDLYSWPVLERDAVRAHELELCARPRRLGATHRYSSGGSFLRVAVDPLGAAWDRATEHRALRWHGLPLDASTLALGGERARLVNWLRRRREWSDADPQSLREALDWIVARRPQLACGTPSALLKLARFAETEQADLPEPPLPCVQLRGEQVFAFQREEIQRSLGARCIETYAGAEVGAIAGECPAGSLHVFAEHVYVEILRGDQPVDPGERGDVVVSSLTNSAMPLIRCRLGDRARLLAAACGCGLALPVLADLQGRSAELLLAPDGSGVYGSRLGRALRLALPGLTPDAVQGLLFESVDSRRWRVRVQGSLLLRDSDLRAIAALTRGVFGPECSAEVVSVPHIPSECRGRYRWYRAVPGSDKTPQPPAVRGDGSRATRLASVS